MEFALALPEKSGVFSHENTSEEDNRNSVHKGDINSADKEGFTTGGDETANRHAAS